LLVKDGDPTFNGFFTAGKSFANYFKAGLSAGYYKFSGADKAVIPVGLDFAYLNVNSKKISPYFTAGAYYPIYSSRNTFSSPGVYVTSESKGIYQFKIGAGIALPIEQLHQIILSGAYMPAKFNITTATSTYGVGRPATYTVKEISTTTDMFSITLEFILFDGK